MGLIKAVKELFPLSQHSENLGKERNLCKAHCLRMLSYSSRPYHSLQFNLVQQQK